MVGFKREYLTSDSEVERGQHYIISEDIDHIKQYWATYSAAAKIGDLGEDTLRELLGKVVRAEATVATAAVNAGVKLSPGVVKCRGAKGTPYYIPVEIMSRLDMGSGSHQTPAGEIIIPQKDRYRDVVGNKKIQNISFHMGAAGVMTNNMSAAGIMSNNIFANIMGNLPQVFPDGEMTVDDDEEDAEDLAGLQESDYASFGLLEYFFNVDDVKPGTRCQITDDFDRIKNQWIQCEQDTDDIQDLKKILDEEVIVKDLEWLNKEISNEMVLNIKHDSVDPWGVTIDFDTWKITRVHYKKQWQRVGARVGYDVLKVNGVSVRSDPKGFKDMLMVGPECTVVLGISDSGIGFRDSFLERNMALAEVEFMDMPGKVMKIPWRSLLNASEESDKLLDFDKENFDIRQWRRKCIEDVAEVTIGAKYKVTHNPDLLLEWWRKADLDPFVDPALFCKDKGVCREVDVLDQTLKLEWTELGDQLSEWFPVQVCTLLKRSRTPAKKNKPNKSSTTITDIAKATAEEANIRLRNIAMENMGAYMDANTGEWFIENVADLALGRTLKVTGRENRLRSVFLEAFKQEISDTKLRSILGRRCNVVSMGEGNNTAEVRIIDGDFDIWVPVRALQPITTMTEYNPDVQMDYPVNNPNMQRRDPARMATHDKAVVLKRRGDVKKEHGIYTYSVKANDEDQWGVKWDWDTWRVESVNENKQFYRLGIRAGWRLLHMNEFTLNKNYANHIQNCLLQGRECELQFNVDKLKVGDEVKMFSVKNEEYEGMTGILIEEVVDEHKWRMRVFAKNNAVKRIPVANVVKRYRETPEIATESHKRSSSRRARVEIEMEDLDDLVTMTGGMTGGAMVGPQPEEYYTGAQRLGGIEVDKHYRVTDNLEMLIEAFQNLFPNADRDQHKEDAEAVMMQVVRVLDLDAARDEATVVETNGQRHHLPLHCLEHIQKQSGSMGVSRYGGASLPKTPEKRKRDFIDNL